MLKKLFFGVAAATVLFTATGAAYAGGCRCRPSGTAAVTPVPTQQSVVQAPGTQSRRTFSVEPSPQPTYRSYRPYRSNNAFRDAGSKIRGEY